MRCNRCGTPAPQERIGVRDVCVSCSAYLHACLNCDFYQVGVHNDCREPNAERVADKEMGNFCDYFRPAPPAAAPAPEGSDARAQLEKLFKRKSREV